MIEMDRITYIYFWMLIPIVTVILAAYGEVKNKKRDEMLKDENRSAVRLPKRYSFLGIILTFIFAGITIWIKLKIDDSFFSVLLFCLLSLACMTLTFAAQIREITFDGISDSFFYISFFHKECTIKYSECQYFDYGNNIGKLKTDKKTFYIELDSTNLDDFILVLIENDVKMYI